MAKRLCAILGASGIVSQRLQQRLANHPWFELVAICGGPDTAGKPLSSIGWKLEQQRPTLAEITVLDLSNSKICKQLLELGVSIVFSAIPSEVAQDVEPMLAESGFAVFSNASAYRRVDGIPLVIAEIGINHNGDLAMCKELIDVAVDAGCDAVKFQKRDIKTEFTKESIAEEQQFSERDAANIIK